MVRKRGECFLTVNEQAGHLRVVWVKFREGCCSQEMGHPSTSERLAAGPATVDEQARLQPAENTGGGGTGFSPSTKRSRTEAERPLS